MKSPRFVGVLLLAVGFFGLGERRGIAEKFDKRPLPNLLLSKSGLLVARYDLTSLGLYLLSDGKRLRKFTFDGEVRGFAATEDERFFLVLASDKMTLFDLRDGTSVWTNIT